MIDYSTFVPDEAAERSVLRALDRYREIRERQGRTDVSAPVLAQGLAQPDPRYVYDHAATFCQDHFMMLWSAETDCAPLFRLRIEGMGDTSKLEFFLREAAMQGSTEVVRYIAPHTKDINERDEDGQNGYTALHWAVSHGHLATVCALLEQPEINLEIKGHQQTTPLGVAVRRNSRTIARHLLDAGAQFDPESVLHAAGSHNGVLVEFAIAHAPDLNIFGKQGITPLHAAVTAGDVEGAKKLLAAGADPTLPSRRKFKRFRKEYPRDATPADFARIRGDAALEALFA